MFTGFTGSLGRRAKHYTYYTLYRLLSSHYLILLKSLASTFKVQVHISYIHRINSLFF